MARTVTVSFADGSQHVYQNVPDNAKPEDIQARAGKDFSGKQITNIDGGKKAAAPVQRPSWGNSLLHGAQDFARDVVNGAVALPDMAAQAGHAVTNGVTNALVGGGDAVLRAFGANDTANKLDTIGRRATSGPAPSLRAINNRLNPEAPGRASSSLPGELLGGAMVPFGPKGMPARTPMSVAEQAAAIRPIGSVARTVTPQTAGQAAERQGITMMPADVGGTATRMASGIARRTLGEIPMAEGARNAVRSASNAVQRVAAQIGRPADEAGAGQAAQRGAKAFIRDSEAKAGKLYDAIAIPPQREAALGHTNAALADLTAGLESNPELSKLISDPRLIGYQKAIAGTTAEVPTGLLDQAGNAITRTVQKGGKLSWQDLKSFRTYIGEKLGSPALQSDTSQNALKALYGALSKDMEATATAEGPTALTQFRRANQFYRGRADRIENVLSGILGNDMNKGDEAAFAQINRWAADKTGDANKLARAMRSMPDDEAGTVRASIVAKMGRASAGRQNADGTEFSPAEFATQWNKMSSRAKSILFPDAGHRSNLDDLAVAMDGMKRAGQYANTSNTSLGTNAAGHIAGLVTHPILTAILAGGEFSLGTLLSSPRVARMLTRMPAKATPGAVRSVIGRLDDIAKQEPSRVASEIKVLQSHLANTFLNDNVGVPAAAGDRKENQQEQQPALQP